MKFTSIARRELVRVLMAGSNINFDVFYRPDHVAYFPELKLVFNRIKKSGNTTICAFLNELSGQSRVNSSKTMKAMLRTPQNMSPLSLRSMENCYSFAAVRNPFSRALSAYLQRVEATNLLPRDPLFSNGPYVGVDGFEKFLEELANGKMMANRHYWPQHRLLYKPVEKFSRIIKLENVVDEMRVVLRENNLNDTLVNSLASPHNIENEQKGKVTGAKLRMPVFYNPNTVNLVKDVYRTDFALFGYDPGESPLTGGA